MAKTVFGSHSAVAHEWAHNDNPARTGRVSSGRMFFRGHELFSYGDHYVIARRVTLPAGMLLAAHDDVAIEPGALNAQAEKYPYIVLENSEASSMSTKKHHSEMRSAARHLRMFRVPFPSPHSASRFASGRDIDAREEFNGRKDHAANLAYLVARIADRVASAKRMIDPAGEWIYESVREQCATAFHYARIFGLPAPALDALALNAEIQAEHERKREARRVKRAKWERKSAALVEQYIDGSIDAAIRLQSAPASIRDAITTEHGLAFRTGAAPWLLTNETERVAAYRAGNDAMPREERRGYQRRSWRRDYVRNDYSREALVAETIRATWRDEYVNAARARLASAYPTECAAFTSGNGDALALLPAEEARQIIDVFATEHALGKSAADIARWRNGERVYFGYSSDLPIMLRVNGDNIETSRAASFPVADARRALPLLARIRERLTENAPEYSFRRDGDGLAQGILLGSFRIDAITRRGVKAGCHFVEWQEIERGAALIGEQV